MRREGVGKGKKESDRERRRKEAGDKKVDISNGHVRRFS